MALQEMKPNLGLYPIKSINEVKTNDSAQQKNLIENNFAEQKDFLKNEIKNIAKANELISDKANEEVTAFITDDRNLLDQYYTLRNDIFQNERGWTKHTWFENEFDRRGKIIVAVDKAGKVVGGGRVIVSFKGSYLSDEFPGTEFTYANLLTKIGLDSSLGYAEIDGVIVVKERRNNRVMKAVVGVAASYAEQNNCGYLIGISSLAVARKDRAVFRSLGYNAVFIATTFPWKELEIYNNSRDFPVIGTLNSKNPNLVNNT